MEKEINVTCPRCMVNFNITIEPSYPMATIESEFTDSYKAHAKMNKSGGYCPYCGTPFSKDDIAQ